MERRKFLGYKTATGETHESTVLIIRMRNRLTILSLLMLPVLSTGAQGNKESKVAEAVENLRKAMIDPDKNYLEGITHDQLSYGHSSGLLENRKEFIGKLVSGRSDFVTIELKEQTISVTGKTAIVRHLLDAKTNDAGRPGEVRLRVLLVWQKSRGKWKLLARQAVK